MRRALAAALLATAVAAGALGTLAARAAPPAAGHVCEPPFREPQLRGVELNRIDGTRHALAWHAEPGIAVSEFFALEVAVCAAEGQPVPRTLRVDASMPEHQHGMNYRASVRPRGPGRFVAEGLLFHMPGRWQLRFEINVGAQAEVLTADVIVR
ncbi:MAG: FixH family protein [Betaproteobacteria bacterium]